QRLEAPAALWTEGRQMLAGPAREDLDKLLNALLPFAQQILEQHGEFYPFGAALDTVGGGQLFRGYKCPDGPSSPELIDLMLDGFRESARRGQYRATGLCADVRAPLPNTGKITDAIRVTLEHTDGQAVHVFLPYSKTFWRRLRYGELFAS